MLASNWKPPVKKGFATKAYFRGGGGLFIAVLPTHGFAGGLFLPTCIEFGLRLGVISARAAKAVGSDPIGFTSRMHFGYYLMIAALVLMGLEVLYALYQLATFL